MNVCILCGAAPNMNDAVGDYSWLLAHELSKAYTVSVIVPGGGETARRDNVGSIAMYRVKSGWGIQTSRDVLHLIEELNPQVILVHFVPQLYGWNGAKPCLAMLLLVLQRKGYRIVTVAHEFSAQFGPTLKLMAWASIHQLLLRTVLKASRRMVLTTGSALDFFTRRFPERRADFCQIPISSTIPVVPVDEAKKGELRRKLGIAPEELVVSTFGSVVGSVTTLLGKIFRWFIREGGPVRFMIIGKGGEKLHREFANHQDILERMVLTGPLSNEAVSEYLSLSDIYAVFYDDGASTRRTSLMVGLAHGLPVISNAGALTDPLLESSGALHLTNRLMGEGETRALRQLSKDPELRRQLGRRGRVFYEEHFSWQTIGRQYVKVLGEVRSQ